MNKKREGYYVVAEFTAEPKASAELDRFLVLADEVMRHKIIRVPDKVAGRAPGARRPGRRTKRRPGRETRGPADARLSRLERSGGDNMANGNNIVARGEHHPGPRAALHPHGPGHGHLRAGGQPPLAEPPDPGVGGGHVVLRRRVLAGDGRERGSESLARGSRVIVTGRLDQRSWETQDGDKRSKVEVIADEIGPSLRWATAQVTKNERRGPAEGAPGPAVAAARTGSRLPGSRRRVRLRRGALLTHGAEHRTIHQPARPQGRRAPHQEETLRACVATRSTGSTTRTSPAAQVHERPGQDPRPARHRELRRSTSVRSPWPSRRRASWSCCPTPSAP